MGYSRETGRGIFYQPELTRRELLRRGGYAAAAVGFVGLLGLREYSEQVSGTTEADLLRELLQKGGVVSFLPGVITFDNPTSGLAIPVESYFTDIRAEASGIKNPILFQKPSSEKFLVGADYISGIAFYPFKEQSIRSMNVEGKPLGNIVAEQAEVQYYVAAAKVGNRWRNPNITALAPSVSLQPISLGATFY